VALIPGVASGEPSKLWAEYVKSPDTHPNIPNCSYAGYRYGEEALPSPRAVVNVRDMGARGDGKADDTQAIRKALARAGEVGGGAVLLPAGTYNCSAPIFIHDDGVVLRGEGSGKTTLYFTKNLEQGHFVNKTADGKSSWSWAGGLVWITPRQRNGADVPPEKYGEGWLSGRELAAVTAPARRGQHELAVSSTSAVKAGDYVLLTLDVDKELLIHMAGEVEGTRDYPWETKAATLLRRKAWHWPVQVAAVKGNTLTLRQPLRIDLRAQWKPRLVEIGPTVREAGVEGMTIRMKPDRTAPHLMEPGWNGPYFNLAINCFARDIAVHDSDNGFGTSHSKNITLLDIRTAGRAGHHAIACRGADDILHYNFAVENIPRHGINLEGLNSGNVYAAGVMKHGTFDSHLAEPFENIRTDITIFNDGSRGGAGDAGPIHGARAVHWNVRVTGGRSGREAEMVYNPQIMPWGALVGIQGAKPAPPKDISFHGDVKCIVELEGKVPDPPNLHRAQLRLRLGREPAWLRP